MISGRWVDIVRRAVCPTAAQTASPALVFLSLIVVSAFQIPTQWFVMQGMLFTGLAINEIIGVAGTPLLIARAFRFDFKRLFPWRSRLARADWAWLVLLMFSAVVLMDFATAASEWVLPLPESYERHFESLMAVHSGGEFALKLVALCILPGVCEEIYFRGFFQGSLAQTWKSWRALVVASLCFALLHGNIYYLHLLFLLGLFFGWVYSLTGTLLASICCHIANNAWTFVTHVVGVTLPLEGVAWWINAGIVLPALFLFVLASRQLHRRLSPKPFPTFSR